MCQPSLPCPCPTTPILVHGIDKKGAKTSTLSRKNSIWPFQSSSPNLCRAAFLTNCCSWWWCVVMLGTHSSIRWPAKSGSFWSNDAMGDTEWGATEILQNGNLNGNRMISHGKLAFLFSNVAPAEARQLQRAVLSLSDLYCPGLP
jgi:hypothetical protein